MYVPTQVTILFIGLWIAVLLCVYVYHAMKICIHLHIIHIQTDAHIHTYKHTCDHTLTLKNQNTNVYFHR